MAEVRSQMMQRDNIVSKDDESIVQTAVWDFQKLFAKSYTSNGLARRIETTCPIYFSTLLS